MKSRASARPEHGEHFVDREFLAGEHRGRLPRLGREEPRVGGQVELCLVVFALDDEAREARVFLDVVDDQASLSQRPVGGRDEPIDGGGCETEEVEVAGLPLDVAAGDERGAAGEGEVLRFLEAGDDLSDPLLQRAQHSSRTWRWRRNHSAHALRTVGGSTSSSQSSSSWSAST